MVKYQWTPFKLAVIECGISSSNLKDMIMVNFIIDPGATHTFISEWQLNELGFAITESFPIVTATLANGEIVNACIVSVPSISFGGREFKNVQVRTCKGFKGPSLIGLDILSNFEFSYTRHGFVEFEYLYDDVVSRNVNYTNVFGMGE